MKTQEILKAAEIQRASQRLTVTNVCVLFKSMLCSDAPPVSLSQEFFQFLGLFADAIHHIMSQSWSVHIHNKMSEPYL